MNRAISSVNGSFMKFNRIIMKRHIIIIDVALIVGRLVRFARMPFVTTKTKVDKTRSFCIETFIIVEYMFLWISSDVDTFVSNMSNLYGLTSHFFTTRRQEKTGHLPSTGCNISW